MTGKTVLTQLQRNAYEILDIEKLLPGVYFLHGVSGDLNFRKRVILQ